MAVDRAIVTQSLGKRYTLGQMQGYATLRESADMWLRRAGSRRLDPEAEALKASRSIWALRHVDLEIAKGEVVGVIGPNGAGKSTLMKILSRVTAPTEGTAEVSGRLGSLLEVGTGFHAELTGRENVYLNGAILGMKRSELDAKFDAIVEFAGISSFMDTPVKRYSSGMYVRLAFSVAIHLEPEILLVDEVLSVGDYEFQKRCLEKIRTASSSGETILMVSHNLSAVRTLCDRVVWMEGGTVRMVGPAADCVRAYLVEHTPAAGRVDNDVRALERPAGQGVAFRFTHVALRVDTDDGRLELRQRMRFEVMFVVSEPIEEVSIGFSLTTPDGVRLVSSTSALERRPFPRFEPGTFRITIDADCWLNPGTYSLALGARSSTRSLDTAASALEIEVRDATEHDAWLAPIDGLFQTKAFYSDPTPAPPGVQS